MRGMGTVTMKGGAFLPALRHFKESEEAFTVERTNYAAKVILMSGRRFLFTDTPVRPSLFPLVKRMKDEVRKAGVPSVDPREVAYFSFVNVMRKERLPARAWSIDMSSAYAHALHRRGLVTDATFADILALKKDERLRVVGMLATVRSIMSYRRGRITSLRQEESDTRGAFFACCYDVGEVMKAVERFPGHLFFWVDGAFSDRPCERTVEYFRKHGYPCKVEEVTDLAWSESRRHLYFTKNGERKYLSPPGEKHPAAAWILRYLDGNQ